MHGGDCSTAIIPFVELYSYDKMNSLMHQAQVKDISVLPAAIDNFEREVARFKQRTGLEFPEMLKMPILL